ncbi:MAG: hypothetical protein J0L99_09910 [Chitinophagales bacterium]|nr:hypothetical protein [Chitinophagales bacterium]
MLNSSLLITFRLLNAEEWEALDYFVASPLFKLNNRHQDAVALLNYLKPHAPDFSDAAALEREQVAASLFGHRANAEAELRKAMSNLNNILRKMVLLQQAIHADNVDLLQTARTELAMMRFYYNRLGKLESSKAADKKNKQADAMLEQLYNSIISKTETETLGDINTWTAQQYLELLHIRFEARYIWFNFNELNNGDTITLLLDAIQEQEILHQYLRLDLLTILQAKLTVGNVLDKEKQALEADVFIAHTLRNPPQIPLQKTMPFQAAMYYYALQMLRDLEQPSGVEAFNQLDDLLRSAAKHLPNEQILGLKAVQRLFCSIVINRTRSPFFQQRRFELVREHTEQEMLLRNGQLSAVQFSSLLSDAFRSGPENYAWAEAFLRQFDNGKNVFATETPREVYKVNKANLLFHQGQYREAANELIGYEWYGRIDEPQVLLLAIRIDLKTRYERGLFDDEHTLRTLDAVEKRVGRLQEINPQFSGMTLAFLRLVKQLFNTQTRLRQPKTSGSRAFDLDTKRAQLLAALEEQPVAEKGWLREKVEGL